MSNNEYPMTNVEVNYAGGGENESPSTKTVEGHN
jgi:hypothetical protein